MKVSSRLQKNCCLKSVQEKFNIGENRNNRKKLAKFRKRLEEEKKRTCRACGLQAN